MAAKIDHAKIKRLVVKYRKDTTVFKHYRKTNKNGKKAVVLQEIAKIRGSLPLRLRNPKMYAAKLKHQKKRSSDQPTKFKVDFVNGLPSKDYDDDYMKYTPNHEQHAPPWAKAADRILTHKPFTCVKKTLQDYLLKDVKLVSEIEALKIKLMKAETKQIKVRGRIECIKLFLADEKTITITEWMSE
tara:strand:- start:38 stop:595 length:558 start_codon:yes stop_codon:yes gene_type:complete